MKRTTRSAILLAASTASSAALPVGCKSRDFNSEPPTTRALATAPSDRPAGKALFAPSIPAENVFLVVPRPTYEKFIKAAPRLPSLIPDLLEPYTSKSLGGPGGSTYLPRFSVIRYASLKEAFRRIETDASGTMADKESEQGADISFQYLQFMLRAWGAKSPDLRYSRADTELQGGVWGFVNEAPVPTSVAAWPRNETGDGSTFERVLNALSDDQSWSPRSSEPGCLVHEASLGVAVRFVAHVPSGAKLGGLVGGDAQGWVKKAALDACRTPGLFAFAPERSTPVERELDAGAECRAKGSQVDRNASSSQCLPFVDLAYESNRGGGGGGGGGRSTLHATFLYDARAPTGASPWVPMAPFSDPYFQVDVVHWMRVLGDLVKGNRKR